MDLDLNGIEANKMPTSEDQRRKNDKTVVEARRFNPGEKKAKKLNS